MSSKSRVKGKGKRPASPSNTDLTSTGFTPSQGRRTSARLVTSSANSGGAKLPESGETLDWAEVPTQAEPEVSHDVETITSTAEQFADFNERLLRLEGTLATRFAPNSGHRSVNEHGSLAAPDSTHNDRATPDSTGTWNNKHAPQRDTTPRTSAEPGLTAGHIAVPTSEIAKMTNPHSSVRHDCGRVEQELAASQGREAALLAKCEQLSQEKSDAIQGRRQDQVAHERQIAELKARMETCEAEKRWVDGTGDIGSEVAALMTKVQRLFREGEDPVKKEHKNRIHGPCRNTRHIKTTKTSM